MTSSGTRASFGTTSWSLIVRAQSDPGDLENLMQAYWTPVYAFIRRKGFGSHDASDLTQDFLCKVLLGRNLLARADSNRGRFRTFLKTAIRNHLIDHHRKNASRAGSVQLDEAQASAGDPDDAPGRAFDRQWAAATLAIVVARLEAACREEGLESHWRAFEASVLHPTTRKASRIPLDELARELGVGDPATVSNMIQTVKRRYRRVLREVVRETVTNENEIEDELAVLKRTLYQGDANV